MRAVAIVNLIVLTLSFNPASGAFLMRWLRSTGAASQVGMFLFLWFWFSTVLLIVLLTRILRGSPRPLRGQPVVDAILTVAWCTLFLGMSYLAFLGGLAG